MKVRDYTRLGCFSKTMVAVFVVERGDTGGINGYQIRFVQEPKLAEKLLFDKPAGQMGF